MEENYESLVDEDIRQEVAAMTATEKAEYLAKDDTETAQRIKELSKPSPYLTHTQRDFLYELIKSGADPGKSSEFVAGHNCHDLDVREIISSQRLISDKEIREQATKELTNSFVNSYLSEHPELPTDFRVELHHARSRVEAQMLLKKYEMDTVAEAKDEGMRFILEQSQSFDLPRLLRSKIAGLSVKNITEAKAEVSELIKNFRR